MRTISTTGCSWWMGCSNAKVRTLWMFCDTCGQKIRDSEVVLCDFHEIRDIQILHCYCQRGLFYNTTSIVDPWKPETLNAWLETS